MYCLKKCSQHVASLFFGYIGHTISRRCAAATRPRGLHKFACVAGWMDSGLLGRKLLFAGRCTTKLGAVTMHMRRPRLLGRRARPVCLHPHLRSSYVPRRAQMMAPCGGRTLSWAGARKGATVVNSCQREAPSRAWPATVWSSAGSWLPHSVPRMPGWQIIGLYGSAGSGHGCEGSGCGGG